TDWCLRGLYSPVFRAVPFCFSCRTIFCLFRRYSVLYRLSIVYPFHILSLSISFPFLFISILILHIVYGYASLLFTLHNKIYTSILAMHHWPIYLYHLFV